MSSFFHSACWLNDSTCCVDRPHCVFHSSLHGHWAVPTFWRPRVVLPCTCTPGAYCFCPPAAPHCRPMASASHSAATQMLTPETQESFLVLLSFDSPCLPRTSPQPLLSSPLLISTALALAATTTCPPAGLCGLSGQPLDLLPQPGHLSKPLIRMHSSLPKERPPCSGSCGHQNAFKLHSHPVRPFMIWPCSPLLPPHLPAFTMPKPSWLSAC